MTWSIVARNLAEHANNPIHTDEGARAAGFANALVAGVTTYAYCCHPILDLLGLDWLGHGEVEVRFRSPIFDGELVGFPVTDLLDGGLDVRASTQRVDAAAVVKAWPQHRPGRFPSLVSLDEDSPGTNLREQVSSYDLSLTGEYGPEYGARAGDNQQLLIDSDYVHPAVWPALANHVFHRELAHGSWVHTRSAIRHHGLVKGGSKAHVETQVVKRFHRSGERAIAIVSISVGGALVAELEHEAIIDLKPGID